MNAKECPLYFSRDSETPSSAVSFNHKLVKLGAEFCHVIQLLKMALASLKNSI